SRLTTWYSTRNGLVNPRSFGARMTLFRLPPSRPARTWYRALVPLVPRPAVLPLEASPRPTRVRAVFAPGAGRRWCTLSTCGRTTSSAFGFAAAFRGADAVAAFAGAFDSCAFAPAVAPSAFAAVEAFGAA